MPIISLFSSGMFFFISSIGVTVSIQTFQVSCRNDDDNAQLTFMMIIVHLAQTAFFNKEV